MYKLAVINFATVQCFYPFVYWFITGLTFTAAKRPNKGHGREIIQLGIPVIEGSFEEEHIPGISRGMKIYPLSLWDISFLCFITKKP
jgi:hypothetical protein